MGNKKLKPKTIRNKYTDIFVKYLKQKPKTKQSVLLILYLVVVVVGVVVVVVAPVVVAAVVLYYLHGSI